MKIVRVFLIAAMFTPFSVNTVNAANSEPLDIEPEDRAKLARIRSQANIIRSQNKGQDTVDTEECGTIDIGNSFGNRRGKTEIDIIIDGDIINAFNECR